MKVTLDHNCIIDLVQHTEDGLLLSTLIQDPRYQCYVVNIGASEMWERGAKPDRYDKFEELLSAAGIGHLERLNPMLMLDITYWDRCVLADDTDIKLVSDIGAVLFGRDAALPPPKEGLDSPVGRKWLNRLCDVHTMWCHIHSGNEIFLTRDSNFHKETKKPELIALGAKEIYSPLTLRHNNALQPTRVVDPLK
jgi:hypothetical protein